MLAIMKNGKGQSKWIVVDEFGNRVLFNGNTLCGPTKEQCEWKTMDLLEELMTKNGWKKESTTQEGNKTVIHRGTLINWSPKNVSDSTAEQHALRRP